MFRIRTHILGNEITFTIRAPSRNPLKKYDVFQSKTFITSFGQKHPNGIPYEQYKDKLVIIGFPCNQFGMQEPGSNQKIKEFCSSKFHVTFTMMDKCDVKGKDQHPIYQWLTRSDLNGIENSEVSWNFNKYLVSADGHSIQHFDSDVTPDSEVLKKAIEALITQH